MQKFFTSIGAVLLLASSTAFAQPSSLQEAEFQAIVTGPDEVAVGRTIVLDGSSSRGLGEKTEYEWFRDDIRQPISRSVEAIFTPEKRGTTTLRLVVTTTINGEEFVDEAARTITIFDRKIVVIADNSVSSEKLEIHRKSAEDAGVFLRILKPDSATLPLSADESLYTLLNEQSAALANAESIVLWTDGIKGLQALMRVVENDAERLEALNNQTIVLITDRSLQALARTARGPFSVLHPDSILITRKEAINPLISAADIPSFQAELGTRDIDVLTVDEETTALRPWNMFSALVNFMLTHGISSQTVTLLLMLPLIATLLAFLKQVIGITTFGLYTPSIIALSFLALGWHIGILFLFFILTTGYMTRAMMKRWRLLYVPKVAIILTVVSITLLLLLALGAYFDIRLSGDTIFVLLIMSTLSESFLNVKSEEGWYSAILGIGETILAALLCVFIVQWSVMQSLILAYPELILFTFVINAFLGRWTGLRLIEYFRFQEVFRHLQEEE